MTSTEKHSLIEAALEDIKNNKMVLLVDDEDRENEGDLVMSAINITANDINFMIQKAFGLICMPMDPASFERLQIPMMTNTNQNQQQTAFGVSFEAAVGITTGISASDRAHTIRTAANPKSTPKDIVIPGHVFPLRGHSNGIAARLGHTEGSLELMKLAKLPPCAVICEVMNTDGTMAKGKQLEDFAQTHQIKMITMGALVEYSRANAQKVTLYSKAKLPTTYGEFEIQIYSNQVDGKEHVALVKESLSNDQIPIVRIHSECMTGDVFQSLKCDCGHQLESALQEIGESGGALIYLRQEGRGIGLGNKIKAYALQDKGLDTLEANRELGFKDDLREYDVAVDILNQLGMKKIILLTNNPKKASALQELGIKVLQAKATDIKITKENYNYLKTKNDKLGHALL